MSNNILENKIEEFSLVTNELCKLLENASSFSKLSFLSSTQKILTLTYLKASLLERPIIVEEGESEKFVQESDWIFIKDQVSSKLALSDKYVAISLSENIDPEKTEEILLSECFADIYQDLRNFSTNFELGNKSAKLVSISECLDNFEKFWGIRTLAILNSIHNMIYGDEAINDEIIENKDDNTNANNLDTSNWLINKRFNN